MSDIIAKLTALYDAAGNACLIIRIYTASEVDDLNDLGNHINGSIKTVWGLAPGAVAEVVRRHGKVVILRPGACRYLSTDKYSKKLTKRCNDAGCNLQVFRCCLDTNDDVDELEALFVATPTATDETSVQEADAISTETPTTAPEPWIRAKQTTIIQFALRLPRGLVDWINGKTFNGVTFDWKAYGKVCYQDDRWGSNLSRLGWGTAIECFVCPEKLWEKYKTALMAAWNEWKLTADEKQDHLTYQVGAQLVEPLAGGPVLHVLKRYIGWWLVYHPDLDREPRATIDDKWMGEVVDLSTDRPAIVFV